MGERMKTPSRFLNGRRALSLFEMLVVMALVSALSMLSIPVIRGMIASSAMAGCTSNLRQIGAAIHYYANDHQGSLPGPMVATTVAAYGLGTPTHLAGFLYPYFGLPPKPSGVPDYRAQVFECPAARKIIMTQGAAIASAKYFLSPRNVLLSDGNKYYPFGYTSSTTKVSEMPLRLSNIREPAKAIALLDADQVIVTAYVGKPEMAATPAHRSGRNILFLDGHVEERTLADSAALVQ